MKKPDLTSKLFTIYTITCLYLVYVAITTFINSDDPERVNVEDINDNILGMHFLNASLFCFYSLFAKNQKRYMKVILVFGLLLFIGSLITTGSRSGMLALGIGMLIIIPKSLNRIGSLLFFLVLSIGLIISIGENNIFIKFAGDRFQQAQDDKGAGRIVIWKVGMAMIEKNPILGVGFRNFPTEFKNYIDYARLEIDETNKLGDRDYAGAHNNVVEILAELGIFGLLSFYILQIVVFIRLYKIFDTVPISKLLFASLFALNFNGLFSDLTNLKIYWTILGLSCGLSYYGLMLIKKNRILPNETINPNIITT
jgi:O-antigen ligase